MQRHLRFIITPKLSQLIMKKELTFGVKRLGSFESTWQIEDFSRDHVLIPSNIRGHSKLSSTNVETMFREKRAKIGEYRIEMGRVRSRLGFYGYTQSLNVVA